MNSRKRLLKLLILTSLGTTWFAGCVTDGAFRDFLTTTSVRTFWQTVATAFQSAVTSAPQG